MGIFETLTLIIVVILLATIIAKLGGVGKD